jgi:signal transduction histidine kinase
MGHRVKYGFAVWMLSMGGYAVTIMAQQPGNPDVVKILTAEESDITKVRMLFEEGRQQWFGRNLKEANLYLQSSAALAKRIGFDSLLADAYNLLGNVHLKLQQYDSAFYFLQQALDTEDESYASLVYETYSKIYLQLGDYPASLDYALKAASGFEQNPEPRFNMLSVFSCIMIGEVLERMGQAERALTYYHKAYKKGLTSSVNWYIKDPILKIANYYVLRNELDRARHLYDTILAIDKDSPSHEPTMHAYIGLAGVAMKEEKYGEAIRFYRKAIEYARQKELAVNIENFHTSLGAAFLSDRQMDSAQYYLQGAILKSGQSLNYSNLSLAYRYLSEWQQARGDYKLAIESFKLHKAYQDSILNHENARMVGNLEILYQTRQQENEIDRLKQVEKEKDLAIQKRNTYIWFAGIVVIVLAIILILLRKNYLNTQRLHAQHVKQMEQQQQVASLQAMINGQEAERTRIARDLHDGLGGLFSTMKMYMSTLQHDEPALQRQELFQKSYSLIDSTAEEVRRIAHNMMPEVLMKLGLVNALQDLCRDVSAGRLLSVSLEVHGMEKRLAPATEIMLFRIVQELLNNIIKHSSAAEAIIQFIREGNRLSVLVEDNGKGFNTQVAGGVKRAGLETIESRVAYLNGKISIDSQKDVGTTVMMDFLLNEE